LRAWERALPARLFLPEPMRMGWHDEPVEFQIAFGGADAPLLERD